MEDLPYLSASMQENLLTLVASSERYCQLALLHIPVDLYSTKQARDIAAVAYAYVQQYGKPPRDHLPDLLEDKRKDKKEGPLLDRYLVNIASLRESGFNEEFVVNQLDKFARLMRMKKTAYDLAEAVQKNDVDKADKIITSYTRSSLAGFDRGMTLRAAGAALLRGTIRANALPLDIGPLDRYELGPAKKELHMFMAPPKRGKTWWLIHLTKQALLNRLRVVYMTLEVSAEIIGVRTIQSLFAMTLREAEAVQMNKYRRTDDRVIMDMKRVKRMSLISAKGRDYVSKRLGLSADAEAKYIDIAERMSDNLFIKAFATGAATVEMIEAYLEQLVVIDRFMPDIVIIDYPDLMKVDTKNYRLNIGELSRDLRGMAVDRNLAMCIASQSNRASVDKQTISERDIAEDFNKIAISDVVLSYNQTKNERRANMARLFVVAARNDVDKFDVKITQAYQIGQFCLSAELIPADQYFDLLPKDVPEPVYKTRTTVGDD